jgi:hypothetical protein
MRRPRPTRGLSRQEKKKIIKNNSDSSEPRQRHCADSSYSRIEGLNLEMFVTVLRQVLKVTVISPVNKEGNTTNACYRISSFRKNCYSSSLYSKTLLTSRRVQFKQANPIVKKEHLQNIWFHTMYVCMYAVIYSDRIQD